MNEIDAIVTLAREALDAGAEVDRYRRECDLLRTRISNLEREVVKLRELVRDMWRDGMCDCDEQYACAECEYGYHERMKELGIEIEVDE